MGGKEFRMNDAQKAALKAKTNAAKAAYQPAHVINPKPAVKVKVANIHMGDGTARTDLEAFSNSAKMKVLCPANSTGVKDVYISLGSVDAQPPVPAVRACLDWMLDNQHANGTPLFFANNIDKLTLARLVNIYAAALSFDMCPSPNALRQAIMDRLTAVPTVTGEIMYVKEHLPRDNGIVTRMITSCFEHREQNQYAETEWQGIRGYVNNITDLANEYAEVEKIRWRRALKAQRGRKGHQNQRGQQQGEGDVASEAESAGGAEDASTAGGQAVGSRGSAGQTAPAASNN